MMQTSQVIDNDVDVNDARGHDLADHPMGSQCAKCNAIFISEDAVDADCPVRDEDHPIDE